MEQSVDEGRECNRKMSFIMCAIGVMVFNLRMMGWLEQVVYMTEGLRPKK